MGLGKTKGMKEAEKALSGKKMKKVKLDDDLADLL